MAPFLPPTPDGIARAAAALVAGDLVAFPTETVYGLGARADDDRAVARLYAAKGRPSFNPLIVHVDGIEAASAIARFDERAERLAETFWPGPLTLVLPRGGAPVSRLATAGLDTVAVRAPSHPVARALLRAAALPVVAPSANRSGHVSPTTPVHVADDLGDRVAAIITGGRSPIGVESTVLDLSGTEPVLLRPGSVTREAIEAAIGPVAWDADASDAAPRAPGRLESHYAPAAPVRLGATGAAEDEVLLLFGPEFGIRGGAERMNLSPTGDLTEAAANLFAMLRTADLPGIRAIAVVAIPDEGLGIAINDRLRRAAAPRAPS
ncbi:MAG: L-threonylcarbamoyladenylate synthase [Rhodospirillales bacterium]|jgi:L-threonylcarbamoyladenylate synthase